MDLCPKIILIRHGETAWNSEGRYQGLMDSPLTERGRRQARAIGRALSTVATPDWPVLVSPLGRARETAAIMGEAFRAEQIVEPRLAEVSVGAWEGLTMVEIEHEYPGALDGTNRHDWYFSAPGGESFQSALDRLSDWLAGIPTPCIAVSHGLAGRIIRGAYLGLGKDAMLKLPVPQDGFFVLEEGAAHFHECATEQDGLQPGARG